MTNDKQILFPYQRNSQGLYFPIIPVSLSFRSKKTDTLALIDSGATISIFKSDVAETLKINIERGEEIYMGGVGGRIKGFIHQLEMEVANRRINVPVVFSYEYLVSLNLLGRQSFFERFKITFDEKKKRIEVE